MRIGNIKVCKNVVKGFVAGTGLGLFIGGLTSYFIVKRECDDTIAYLYDTLDCANEFIHGEIEDGEVNPLHESDMKKKHIIDQLIINNENYKKPDKIPSIFQEINNDADSIFTESPTTNVLNALLEGCAFEDDEESDDEIVYSNVFDDYKDAVVIAEEIHGGEPYLITRKEYLESCLDFNKDTLGYYVDNEILIDDEGDVIEDPEDWIGKNGVSLFGKGEEIYDNGDTIYIRNPWKHADFELVRYFDEFKEGRV